MQQLLQWLDSSQASPTFHHHHPHTDTSQEDLESEEASHIHGHYVADSLLVVASMLPLLLRTLRRVAPGSFSTSSSPAIG
jgi:hypothetical protein